MIKSRYIGDGHPTFNRNPYRVYKPLRTWVDALTIPYYMEMSWELRPRPTLAHMSSMIPTTYLEICFAKTKATPLFSNVQRRVKGLELTSGTTLRIMTEKNTGEQRSKPVNDTSLYWLVYRDPYNGF